MASYKFSWEKVYAGLIKKEIPEKNYFKQLDYSEFIKEINEHKPPLPKQNETKAKSEFNQAKINLLKKYQEHLESQQLLKLKEKEYISKEKDDAIQRKIALEKSINDNKILLKSNDVLIKEKIKQIKAIDSKTENVDELKTNNLSEMISQADLIITATGQPGLIKANMIKPNTIIVDAGTTSENGQIVGDLDLDVYNRSDLILTPTKGGVGPLTITALFDNLYQTILDHFIPKI